jgi:hypothetical protein
VRARSLLLGAGTFASVWLAASSARALDLPKVLKKPLTLEVTEVSILAQRFDARQSIIDEGGPWGQWINRLQVQANWNHFSAGIRLDSGLYWNTLADQCQQPTDSIGLVLGGSIPCDGGPVAYNNIQRNDLSRFQNSIYAAKVWATYSNKGIEVTIGDSYVQFARGLVLSVRKLDDLGVDTTIRGVKANITRGPFALTLVGGLGNPSRVDEATGQALFTKKLVANTNPVWNKNQPQPVFGSDQIYGGELQAGRGKPVILATSMSYLNRCSPGTYRNATGQIDQGLDFFNTGSCEQSDVDNWVGSLPGDVIARQSRHITNMAQSFEVPRLGKFGSVYVVGVLQHRDGLDPLDYQDGSAVYGTYTSTIGAVSNTVEVKSYRNFYPMTAGVNAKDVSAFATVAYSAPPTLEVITQDNLLGNFNICADGGRVRTDIRMSKTLLLWFQGIYTYTKTEQNALCDQNGDIIGATGRQADALSNRVFDLTSGLQWDFDKGRSRLIAWLSGREDITGTGEDYLHQLEIDYTLTKYISKRSALELIGRHRVRYEDNANLGGGAPHTWVEGENYTGINFAPRWVFSQGIEYSTRDLPTTPWPDYPPWLFLNVGLTYKFTKDSNLRALVGQQRGGLKCISGVCRIFPSFEGARVEVTVRF